ncbi:MAG: hypothetical protein WAS21_33405 [Geminicoccaceae bacterium]
MVPDADATSGKSQAGDQQGRRAHDRGKLTEGSNGPADIIFLDDLIAAHDMKGYLLANGVPLSDDTIDCINVLYSDFRDDIINRLAGIAEVYRARGIQEADASAV